MTKTYTYTYNSLSELIERVHLKPSDKNREHGCALAFKDDKRGGSISGKNWYGIDTDKPSEVINAIKNGYTEGLESIRKASRDFGIEPIKSVRRRRTRGDQGDDLDITRVYSGNIDTAWTRTQKAYDGSAYGKNIKIAVDIGGNCGTGADAMKWRGAYAAALADKYAEAGYSVELFAYAGVSHLCTRKEVSAQFIVKLLDSSETYDIEKMANTISFPGFFRTLIFEAILTVPETVSGSLGRHNPAIPKDLDGAIVIKDIWSLEDVKKHKLTAEVMQ